MNGFICNKITHSVARRPSLRQVVAEWRGIDSALLHHPPASGGAIQFTFLDAVGQELTLICTLRFMKLTP